MKKKITLLILVLSGLFISFDAQASIAASGELVYELIPGFTNQYKFTYKLYKDCGTVGSAPSTVTMCYSNACGASGSIVLSKITTLPGGSANGSAISTGCPGVSTNCTTGSLSGYQEWWYTGNLTLTTSCNAWKFSVNVNSRDNAVLNLLNPGTNSLYTEATFNNTTYPNNSSPTCSNELTIYSCVNKGTYFPILVSDVNSDSIVVESIQPRSANSVCPAIATAISYVPATGTNLNPFPTGGTFNVSTNGLITFTPTQTGIFVFAIRISEYRSGSLIGTTMRDMHVVVQNCNSNSPVLSVDTTSILSGQLIGGEIKSCMSGTLEFCFGIKSPYPGAKLIASDNHAGFAPAATITYNNTGTDSIRACFSWVLNASDTGLHTLSINVTDTTCVPPGIQFSFPLNIPIRVLNTAPITTGGSRCGPGIVNLSASGIGNLYWYLDSLGGSTINSGATFSPNVTSTKTYYVESSLLSSGSVGSVGPPSAPANMSSGGLYSQINQWTIFSVLHPCTLHSVVVYPNAAGTVTLQQKNSTGSTILNSTTITVTAAQIGTPVLMILDWPLSVGNNYQLHRANTSVQLYRSAVGITYPYTNFSISITGNSLNPTYFYWAYNWQISNALNTACISSRTPVTATVLPQITASINSNVTVCQNTVSPVLTLTGSGGGAGPYTFVYKINNGTSQTITTTSGNSVNLTVPTSSAGTFIYKLVSVSNATCSNLQSDSAIVTINPISSVGNATITACNSYTWNGTTFTSSGTYSYTSLNAQGCVNTATLNLTVNHNTTNGNATITACNSYSWNGTTYTSSGVYTYTSLNAQGCINTATLTLTINHSSTNGNETSSACNSYVWNGTTYTSSGSYTYTSLNTQGCTNTATLTLTILPLPTANAGIDKILNCVTTSSAIGTAAIAGNTYSWSPSAGLNSSTIAQPIASPTVTTNYTVTVTGSNGCTASDVVLVTKNNTPPTADAGIDKTLNCTILSTTIGSAAIAGNTYSWSPATGLSSTSVAQPTASPSATTSYTVTVTGSNGCTASDVVVVTRTIVPPAVDAGVDKNLTCVLTSSTIGTTAIAGNAYSWLPVTGLNSSSIAQPSASPTVTTSYTVTVTGANNCSATDVVVVNVNTTPPTANAGNASSLTCTTPSATIGTSAVAGNTYNWIPATGLNATSVAQPLASPNSSTIYTVTVTGSNGCTAASNVTITVNKTPPVANAGPDKTVNCTSSSATIGTTLIAGNTYSWSPAIGLNSTAVAQPLANPTVTTTYTVTVTGANGCTATDAVVVNANFTNTSSVTSCNSYLWSVNGITYTSSGTYTATLTCGTEVLNLTINNNTTNGSSTTSSCNAYTWNATTYTTSGIYTFTSLNPQGCLNTATLNLAIHPKPIAGIGSNATVCQNGVSPLITFSAANGTPPYIFTYKINGGTNQTITTTTGNFVSLAVPTNNAGTLVYKLVSVSDIHCSQTQSDSTIIIVNPLPIVTASNVNVCVGGTVYLVGSPAGGVFNKPNPYTGPSTNYNYTYTNSNGCTATSTNAAITSRPLPTAFVSGGGLACSGLSLPDVTIALTGTPPWNLTYTNGTSTTTVPGIASSPFVISNANIGTYSVTAITDAYCTGTSNGSASVSILTGSATNLINDLGVSELIAPESDCGLSNNETITAKINNYGNSCQSGFNVHYQINNGPVITETINSPSVVPGSFIQYSFNTKANLSIVGNYLIKIYTSLPADSIHSNDTLTANIQHYQALTSPANLIPFNDTTGLDYPIQFSWSYVPNAATYDLYIWKFTDTMPSAPTLANITQINYSYATQNLLYGTKYKWKVVARLNSCNSSSGIQNFTMRKLPDLIIQQTITPPSGFSESTIAVSWKTRNNGPGKTNTSWHETAYLSDAPQLGIGTDYFLGTYGNISALDSGQFYQVPIKTYTLPQGIQGPHFVIVKADQYNAVKEISETNNSKTSDTIQVTLAPYPDLQVSSVVVSPTTVFSNDSLTVTWKVKNLGTGPTSTSSWNDYIYMDTNTNLNVNSSQFMGLVHHSGNMNNVDSYTVTKKILIPLATSGSRFIHAFTDRQNQLFEYVFDNNNIGNSGAITVIQSPLPDLRVSSIYAPFDTLSNGQTFGAQWVVKNEGAVSAVPVWNDAAILCTDSTFTGSTTLLATSLQTDTLKSLYTKVTQQTLTIPQGLAEGNEYLFLKTDYYNQVYESNFENNNLLRKTVPIYIANADLKPTLFQAPATTQSGQTINVSWTAANIARGSILNNSWNDAVYLSSDTTLSSGDILLNTSTPGSLLLAGNQYTKQMNVTIPNAIQGIYYLILKTDRFNTIYESNENNNNKYNAININLAPWPDLQVLTINGPASDTAGTPVLFNAQVKNTGLGSIAALSWVDAIYISSSSNFNAPGRKLLWSVVQNQNIDSGQTYTILSGANLPSNLTAGQYYLYYVTDTGNAIFENTGENNNRLISSPVTIYSQNIDLSVLSAQADTNGVMAGQSLNITWTAKNLGIDDAISYWVDGIYLSNNTTLDSNDVMLGSWTSSPPLLKDSIYTKTKNVTIPNSASGIYYLLVNIDKNHQLNDSIRTNNSFVISTNVSSGGGSGGSGGGGSGSTIIISQPPASDLVPLSFTCPSQSPESQPINISFNIGNTGVGPTLGNNWMEHVYLSSDNTLNSSDIQLSSFTHNGVLNAGVQYTVSNQVILPAGISGNYFLLLKADATDMIYEHQHENNNVTFASIYITPQEPSDMLVTQISTPASSYITGGNMTVNWKIRNQGSNIATGFYRDGIYISSDSLWDVNDLLLGLKDGNVALLPTDSISRQFTLPLNNVATGEYYLIVRTDLLNNIVESNEANNIGISVSKINVDVKELHMDILKADTITSISQLYFKLIIPPALEHETMKLTLKGDSTNNAINKLFLSYANTPTANVYDFSSQLAFAANQEIIVPQLQAGTYYIMALGNDTATNNQLVTLLAKIIPFGITSVNANHGGNTGGVTIQINGAKFSNSTSFRLVDSANNTIIPYSVYYVNETKVFASFNLQNALIGYYDVLAINSSGDTVKLIDGFQVQQGPGSSTGGAGGAGLGAGFVCQIVNIGFDDLLDVQSYAPASVRRNRMLSVTVYFENKGTVDIPIPLLHFVSLGGAPISFIAENMNTTVRDLMFECKEVGGPPDVLRPGGNGYFKVYTKSIAPLEFIVTE